MDRKRSFYYLAVKNLYKGDVYICRAGKRGKLSLEILKRICSEVQIMAFININKIELFCELSIIKSEKISLDKNDFYCVSFAIGSEFVV